MSIDTRPAIGARWPLISTGVPVADAARITVAVTDGHHRERGRALCVQVAAITHTSRQSVHGLTAITVAVQGHCRQQAEFRCSATGDRRRRHTTSAPAAPSRRDSPAIPEIAAELAMLRSAGSPATAFSNTSSCARVAGVVAQVSACEVRQHAHALAQLRSMKRASRRLPESPRCENRGGSCRNRSSPTRRIGAWTARS